MSLLTSECIEIKMPICRFLLTLSGVYTICRTELGTDDVKVMAVVRQIHISRFGKQQLGRTVFIDHISAVIRCCGCTICNMYRAELLSIRCVQVSDGIAITERNYLGQR